MENVLVAEGRLCSSDPKQLVDNIPMGPNAAIVKIEKVIKNDAYLWRPNSEMSAIGDALHRTIAWPIQKIDVVNKTPRVSSPIASSPAGVKYFLPYITMLMCSSFDSSETYVLFDILFRRVQITASRQPNQCLRRSASS